MIEAMLSSIYSLFHSLKLPAPHDYDFPMSFNHGNAAVGLGHTTASLISQSNLICFSFHFHDLENLLSA